MQRTQSQTLERDEHRGLLLEAARLAESAGDVDLVLASHSNLMTSALLWADGDEYDRHLGEYARVAEASRAPIPLVLSAVHQAGATATDGRYGAALEQFRHARQRCETLGDPNIIASIHAGMLPAQRELGRLTRSVDAYRRTAEADATPAYQAMFVWVLCEAGQLDEANARLEALLCQPAELLTGFLRRLTLALLAESVAVMGHTLAAARIRPWLHDEIRNGDCVLAGPNSYFGALRRYEGLAASAMGDSEQAVRDHTEALDVHERMRASGWAARSRYDLALALRARAHRGDEAAAGTLAAGACRVESQLGMPRLLEELGDATS